MQAARKRAEGIEAALGALAAVGTVNGPEVQMLKESLSKAKRFAQERPLDQQNSHTESYLERARKRLTAHDAARQQLVTDIEESEARLERLRAVAVADSARPRSSPDTEVQCLQQLVNQLQEERDALARELRGDIVEAMFYLGQSYSGQFLLRPGLLGPGATWAKFLFFQISVIFCCCVVVVSKP